MDIDYNMDENIYEHWLGSISKLKARKIKLMIDFFGSPKEIYNATVSALEQMKIELNVRGAGFTEGDLQTIIMGKDMDKVKKNIEYNNQHRIKVITMLSKAYPEKLRNIYDPPFMLYFKGALLDEDKKIISIVGARECSLYGSEIAKYLAGALAKEDIIVVSGLARGIDTYAHRGALSQDGITYGIMGCGIDICYPLENINLYMDMQIKGGIISEYGPGVKPLAYHFPMRNRIISGLSDGIVVIEAREKSGSLITVDMGLEQGKNIYAVPGRITDKLSEGCNNLIKIGAKVVTNPSDILEDFQEYTQYKDTKLDLRGILPPNEEIIYNLLDLSPKHVEELVELTGFNIGKLMEHILSLELKDMISQPMKNYYIRRNK